MTRLLRPIAVVIACLVALGSCAASGAFASDRYAPSLRFRTISTPRFDIHYHQGEEPEARRLAAIAETVAASLDETLGRPSGRVQVILVDQSDISNGWATPLPYNTIEIAAAAPGGTSIVGNTSDWLSVVFAHEYAHIVHLSRSQGWIGGLRRVFGRMPLLYPNLYLPQWQIEGLAVHEETALTGQGRVPDKSFAMMADVAAAASRFEPLDCASGGLVDWPSGNAPYVYGAYFHEFLVQRYGEASLRALTDDTARRLPYLGSAAFKRVFGRSLGALWDDFEAARKAGSAAATTPASRLTSHGFTVGGPRFTPDGRLLYSTVSPHEFPALLLRDPGSTTPRRLANRYLGTRIGFTDNGVVFDQLQVEEEVGLQSDLYFVEFESGDVRRLTKRARAADPDVSPDGRTIVCTIQKADRRELAIMSVPVAGATGAPSPIVSEAGVHFSAPRWSPDGRWIAVERVSLDHRSEIVLVDASARRLVRTVAATPGSRSVSPAWRGDGRLLFASDRDGDGFRIFITDVESAATWRIDNTGPNAQSPELSPDGRTLVFVGYTADGYDLFSVPIDESAWLNVTSALRPSEASPLVTTAQASPDAPSRRYTPWSTIAPRFWTPTFEIDSDELVVGAATGGADALGRHVYAAEVGWSAHRGRPDWQAAYAYDRWRPTLFANVSDDVDPWFDGEVRTLQFNAGALYPIRRVRWAQTILGAWHSSLNEAQCAECEAADRRQTRRALRAGWLVNASRSFGYSISREEGWNARVTSEWSMEAIGADGDGQAVTGDLRGYVAVWPKHAVVAARAAGAASWGDVSVRRLFSASGNGSQSLAFDFDFDAVGLVRGLDDQDVFGTRAAVVNVDYRFPLLRIERGVGTLPGFARVVHGAVFVDAGHGWQRDFRGEDVVISTGAEVSLDAVIGYSFPLSVSTGAAWVSEGHGFSWFARIGRAF